MLRQILITLFCLLCTLNGQAATQITEQVTTWQLFPDKALSLEDVVGTPNNIWTELPLNHTLTNAFEKNYWEAPQGEPVWVKIQLPRLLNTNKIWLELTPNVGLDGKMALYENGRWVWKLPAGRQGSDNPDYPATFLTFEVENPREHRLIFLRIKSSQILNFSIGIRSESQQSNHVMTNHLFNGFVFGLLILAAIYNLTIGISASEKLYIYYASYVFSTLLYLLAMTGYPRIIFPEWGGNGSFSNLTVLLAIFTGTLFVRELLDTKQTSPRLDLVLKIQQTTIFLSIFSIGFTSDLISYLLAEIIGVIAPALLLVAGLVALKNKHPLAKYFLMAWTLFIATSVVWAWMWLGFVEPSISTLRLFLFGSVIEVMMLSLVLGYRYSELKKQTINLNENKKNYQSFSNTDFLTGLFNRQGLYEQIKLMLKNAKSDHIWIEIDIDDFSTFNIQQGLESGDQLLQQFGQILKTKVRRDNLAAKLIDKENSFSYRRGVAGRTGGGKFTLLLSNCSIPQARLYAERLMRDFGSIKINSLAGNHLSPTICVCVVMVMQGERFEEAWRRATHKITETKEKGQAQLSFP